MSELSEFADGRNLTSPDSEQIEYIVAKQLVRNSVSVEQIQDEFNKFVRANFSNYSGSINAYWLFNTIKMDRF